MKCFPPKTSCHQEIRADCPSALEKLKSTDKRITVIPKVYTRTSEDSCLIRIRCTELPECSSTIKTKVVNVKSTKSRSTHLRNSHSECGCSAPPINEDQNKSDCKLDKPKKRKDRPKGSKSRLRARGKLCEPVPGRINSTLAKRNRSQEKCCSDGQKQHLTEEKPCPLKPKLSSNTSLTSKQRLRCASNDSHLSCQKHTNKSVCKTRNRSAPDKCFSPNDIIKCKTPTCPSKTLLKRKPSKSDQCKTTVKKTSKLVEKKIEYRDSSEAPCKNIKVKCESKTSRERIPAKKKETCDVGVQIRCPICTCATQCHSKPYSRNREVIENICEEIFTTDYTLDDGTLFSGFSSEDMGLADPCPPPATSKSKVAVAFCDRLTTPERICHTCFKPITRRLSIKRTNQATLTERARLNDVSTVTRNYRIHYERRHKRRRERRRRLCDKAICTDGKLVKFRSRTQVIPRCGNDVLSPSRYLLESQRQFNEVLSSKLAASIVCPAIVYHHRPIGFCTSKIKRNSQRGHLTKREEELSTRRQRLSRRHFEVCSRSDDTALVAVKYLRRMRRRRAKADVKLNKVLKPKFNRHTCGCDEDKISSECEQNLHVNTTTTEDKISMAVQCSASSF